ncbi:MAG: hypothetical protein E7241_05505 [Lachnospiraceae bacterium]|nr:hypothetical protein [Lachnospiraceae bacterium]
MGSMFNNISRMFDSNKDRSDRRGRRRSYDDERRYYSSEDHRPEREAYVDPGYADIREMGREKEELKAQVAELKHQVALLNNLIDVKENQVKELETAMEKKDTETMDIINESIKDNNRQIQEMTEDLAERISQLSDKIDTRFDDVLGKVSGSGTGNSDEIINTISDNVHNESVKCYRNIQTILEEIEDKLDVIESKKVSITGTTACVVITMLVSMGNLALIVLKILGIV